ncbi:MAG: hypothetical protein AB7O78_08605 [Thermoleophilia bacterium]
MTRTRRSILLAVAALAALAGALVPAAPAAPGARWIAPVVLESGTGALPPVVAMTPAGESVVAWARAGADPGVWVSVRPPDTAAWPAPVRVSAPCPGGGCLYAQTTVTAGADGTIGIAWITVTGGTYQVTAVRRPTGAGAFGVPVGLGAAAPQINTVVLGVDGQGEMTAAWNTPDGDVWSSQTTTGAWGAPVKLTAAAQGGLVRLSVGAGGDALATWPAKGCQPTAARRRGGAWEAPVALDPGSPVCPGVIDARITPSGEALVVWDGRRGPDPVLLSAWSGPAATAWTTPQAVGISDGRSVIFSRRLSRGPGAGSRLVWQDDQGHTLTSARPDGGTWAAPAEVPGMSGVGPVPASAVGGDGTVLVATGAWTVRPGLATAATAAGAWATPVPIAAARPLGGSDVLVDADAAGEGVAAWFDNGGVVAADFTARPGGPYVLPPASITAVRAPARAPVGSLAVLDADATLPGGTTAVQVQRHVGGAWRPYATVRLVPADGGPTARASVRMRARGQLRLRLAPAGAPPSPAVTVRAVRPARSHLPVGPAPSRLVVGAGGVWVLGQDAGGATVRRLDPSSGAVRRTFPVGGTATGLAAGAGALWVTRGAELLRLDPATGAVTASSRLCGRGTPVAGREGVWVAGACVPEEVQTIGPATPTPTVAYRIDPASATSVGGPLRMPGLNVGGGSLAGGVLWLTAGGEDFRDGLTVGRFAVASGAPIPVRAGSGLYGTVVPVDATRVWTARGREVAQAVPRRRAIARGGDQWALAPAPGRVWALSSDTARDGTTTRRLTSFTRGGRKGAVRAIGVSPPAPGSTVAPVLAVGFGAAWVLLPDEGAVVRVPLAGASRR